MEYQCQASLSFLLKKSNGMALLARNTSDALVGGITCHFKRLFKIRKSKDRSLDNAGLDHLESFLSC